MSYASSGLIEAVDYNNLAWGGTQGTYTTATKNVAYVMGVGSGAVGYGQDISAINTVAAAGTVTATQWSGLLTTLNRALGHQLSLSNQVSVPTITAGGTITYAATLANAINTINGEYAAYTAQGATTTGVNFTTGLGGTTGVNSYTDRIVQFASAQHARYFFNAGGQLNFVVSATGSNGSGSSNSIVRLMTGIGGFNLKNTTNSGRTGSGITLNTNNTAVGYRSGLFNSGTTVVAVTDTTGSYTNDTASTQYYYGGTNDTTNGAVGSTLVFRTSYYVADHSWDDTLGVTINTRVDIVSPESTYLTTSSAWGMPVVS
jgi:hypothetical protein